MSRDYGDAGSVWSARSPNIGKESSNWLGKVSSRAFLRIEISAYLILGLLLAIVGLVGTVSAMFALTKAALDVGTSLSLVVTIDRILLVLMVIEILHTVRVSFNEGALVCEPFLIVGLIASIRRVLVITLESFASAGAGTMDAGIAGAVRFLDDRTLRAGRIDSGDGLVDLSPAPQQSVAIGLLRVAGMTRRLKRFRLRP